MDEDLEYSFTEGSSVLGGPKTSDPDVSNISVLKQVLKELAELKASYHTTDRLTLNDKNFTVEQQLSNNKWAVGLIGNIELLISEKIKELSNGR
jgi:hypothetical protein